MFFTIPSRNFTTSLENSSKISVASFDVSNVLLYNANGLKSYKVNFEENGIVYSLMFVIVACDGLYDMLENEIIVEYVINKFYDNYLKIVSYKSITLSLQQYKLINKIHKN